MRLAAPILLSILSFYAPETQALLPDECSHLPAVSVPLRIIYVDADDPACGPAGSYDQPLCALQPALDAAVPGDAIRVRRTTLPYAGPFIMRRSGTATNPIVIENDPTKAQPVFSHGGQSSTGVSAALYLEDTDYVTIRSLVFDGFNQLNLAAAIQVHAKNRNTIGVDIRRNTIRNWVGRPDGEATIGRAIFLSRATSRVASQQKVWCNKLQNNASDSIRVAGTFDTIVAWNEITGQRCGLVYDDATRTTRHGNSSAIKVSNFTSDGSAADLRTVIRGNLISQFDQHCEEAEAAGVHANWQGAIWCDVGAMGGLVEDNTIQDALGSSTHGPKWGIHIESRCDNWTVRNNTVIGANNAPGTAAYRARNTHNTTFTGNLSCGGERAYWVLNNSGKSVNVSGNTAYGGAQPLLAVSAIINGVDITGYNTSQLTTIYQQTNVWNTDINLCPTP